MSTFLTGKPLETTIEDIILNAQQVLLLVSPFIKLDDHFKKLFNDHKYADKLHVIIVFGKNEKMVSKSLSKEDFEFFQQFPKVSIIYAPKLHGKYYGNEKQGVVTSANLYDYTFINENIEFGVYSEQSIFNQLGITSNKIDNAAFNKCIEVAEENEVVFIKRPVYKPNKLILNLGKSYTNASEVLLDNTKNYYGFFKKELNDSKKLNDFPEEIILGNTNKERPVREKKTPKAIVDKKSESVNTLTNNVKVGYCIRRGVEIPFNPQQPLCLEAWKEWNEYKNDNYPETYCHKTGKLSFGKTSMANPILK
jgi:hypothetical protein